jgi:4'-phosphopantetheinyl transferase EntD
MLRYMHGSDVLISRMQRLFPNVAIVGGTFARRLPAISDVGISARQSLFLREAADFRNKCVLRALSLCRLETRLPTHGRGGNVRWPTGFCGSITHKGTVVVVALCPVEYHSAIGIDLELAQPQDKSLSQKVICPDGVPKCKNPVLLSFSAKEAFFKAQYAASRTKLDYADVAIEWKISSRTFIPRCVLTRAPKRQYSGAWTTHGRWIATIVTSAQT